MTEKKRFCKNCKHLQHDGMFGIFCEIISANNENYDCLEYEEKMTEKTNLEKNGGVTMNDEYQEVKEMFVNGALNKTKYFIDESLKKMENGKQLFGGFPTGIYLMNDEHHSGLTIKSDDFPNLEYKLTIKYEMEVKELVEDE